MRRQDIQWISRARRGDPAACFEVGRLYLGGVGGFPRHVPLGLQYLSQVEVQREDDAERLILGVLDLHEIVAHQRLGLLQRAARAGSADAQLRLAIWTALSGDDLTAATGWLRASAASGSAWAQQASARVDSSCPVDDQAVQWLRALQDLPRVGWHELLMLAMDRATAAQQPGPLLRSLSLSLTLEATPSLALADRVHRALWAASQWPGIRITLDTSAIERLLDDCVNRDNIEAAWMLGTALSGRPVGELAWHQIVRAQNLRKASALLLRAADAGYRPAWMRLYELHSNNQCSVANLPMARFFLEKAAAGGDVCAQRCLGTQVMRSAVTVREVEQGMSWLSLAAQQEDPHAQRLLQSFLLPVGGEESSAQAALLDLARTHPFLAARLRVARAFGLTKLEALTVDLSVGWRSWGLVVGKNPYIQHARLASPRCVPAIGPAATDQLRISLGVLASADPSSAAGKDPDLRLRAARLRQVLASHDLSESLFLARASSDTLDALRGGVRWARRVKPLLDAALGNTGMSRPAMRTSVMLASG